MKFFRLYSLTALAVSCASAQTYTAQQASAGSATYAANCAGCHAADLAGRGEAPELAGRNFMRSFGTRTIADLVAYMQRAMPPTNPGGLGADAYVQIAAFILQSNGAPAGAQALAANNSSLINSTATGQRPAVGAGAANEGAAPQPAGGQRGLTITGTVKNFTPVTDAMLKNPDPGDWLMIRRNYQAWSYSPLNQITTANVKDLQLEWVWAMNEGAWNEPTPIVHNGIMFLANTGQHRSSAGCKNRRVDLGKSRRLRIADRHWPRAVWAFIGDKVFLATTDAHIVALDARTGKLVWDTTIADRKKGYQQLRAARPSSTAR